MGVHSLPYQSTAAGCHSLGRAVSSHCSRYYLCLFNPIQSNILITFLKSCFQIGRHVKQNKITLHDNKKVMSIQQVFKMGKAWEFTLPDRGQAADSSQEVSQAQHFSCLCTLGLQLVETGNYFSFWCVFAEVWASVTACRGLNLLGLK